MVYDKKPSHATVPLSKSLISFSFKWRYCSFVILKSLWQKPVLTTHLSRNHHWGSHLSKVLKHSPTVHRTKYRQSQSTNSVWLSVSMSVPYYLLYSMELLCYPVQNCPSGSFLFWGGPVGRRGIVYDIVWMGCPRRTPWTMLRRPVCCLSYRRLSPQFQFSLSAAILVYLSRWSYTEI